MASNNDGWEDVPLEEDSADGWEEVPVDVPAPAAVEPEPVVRKNPYSKAASAFQGATSGITMGFDDELSGGMSGVMALLKGQSPVDAYTKERDRYRTQKDLLQSDNPMSYGGGSIGGSMLMPGGAAIKGGRLGAAIMSGAKVGAIQGGVQGVGDAKELRDIPGNSLGGAAAGGVLGGAAGGIFRGLMRPGKTANEVSELATETIPAYFKAGKDGFVEGAKSANEAMGSVASPFGGASGAYKAVRDQARKSAEFKGLVDESRAAGESMPAIKTFEQGLARHNTPRKPIDVDLSGEALTFNEKPDIKIRNPPEISDDLGDKEYVARMMLEPGPSKIKQFYAEKGASQFPGQLDSKSYNRLLEMGTDGRTKARTFNRDQAGEDLVPKFEKTKDLFKEARSQRFGELQDSASKQYEGKEDILIHIGDALEDSVSTNSTKGIEPLLQDIQNLVATGKGTKRQGLQPGNWDEIDNTEKFKRLQSAREQLYKKKLYAKKEGLSEAEFILDDLTRKIDAELKTSPDKVEADGMYSASKNLEKSFFDKADFQGGVDKYKIGNMLQGTESAKRFRDNIGRFETFINDPGLNPKLKAEGQKLLEDFRGAANTAEEQRALNEFRFRNGPSSAAIERQTAIMGGPSSPLAEAVNAPSGFMNSADEFAKSRSQRFFGRPYSKLDPSEKDKLVKVWFWEKKNPEATREELEAYFKKVNK